MRNRTQTMAISALSALALAVPLAATAAAASHDVDVVDNAFEPPTLTVTVGDDVTWTSSGTNPHTVTADDGSFDSNPDCESFADAADGDCMEDGDSFEHTFDQPGEHPYFCRIHGGPGGAGMAGTIVVEAAATDDGDGAAEDTDTDDADDTDDAGTATDDQVSGAIAVSDQSGDGTSVVVDSVTITGATGFVVIHADDDGAPGAVIGHTAIPEGTSTAVSVPLDEELTADATVWPMLHVDAGETGTYEFPGPDGPVSNEDGVVVASLAYTVDAGALPRTGPPAGAALVALAALLALGSGSWLLRRTRVVHPTHPTHPTRPRD